MKLHQFLHEVAATSRLLDASGRDWLWPPDEMVRVANPEQAAVDETVLVVVDLAEGRADDESLRLHAVPDGRSVVILVEPAPDLLPVGAVVDLLVAGGILAIQAAPISAERLGTAILGWRSSGDIASISPHLDPRRQLSLTPGAAMLRLNAERVVEGVAWRALEVSKSQAIAMAEGDRDKAQKIATDVRQELADYRSTAEQQIADLQARRADVEARFTAVNDRLQGILASRSYQLARALGAPVRWWAHQSASKRASR
jgi:hypothetical protein